MIPALIKGKLTTQQQNLEDVLTSTVFGLLQYVSLDLGLMRLFALAVPYQETLTPPLPQAASDSEYKFWPWLQQNDCHGAEPDVLITLSDKGKAKHLILVEAKYHSGKSSFADWTNPVPTDQLAREWDNLVSICESKQCVPHMVYITADYGIPKEDISEAAKEFLHKRPEKASTYPLECHWLSWRHVNEAFKEERHPILQDLCNLSQRYGFSFFAGITPIAPRKLELWKFTPPNTLYSFEQPIIKLPLWSFKR